MTLEAIAPPNDYAALLRELTRDPVIFCKTLWPDVILYKQQREMLYSVRDNDETYVPAGNMLGKDFTAGIAALYFFLTRHPCRIVTTSAKDDHLRVLWGEINNRINTSRIPLSHKKGGPLVLNHQNIRKLHNGELCAISYLTSLVASPDSIAAMQGHHVANTGDGVPRTMFISDESSSVMHDYYTMARTWANRMLMIGNTWPCENFFKQGVEAGDLKSNDGKRFYRKVIRIAAEDSPNVRYAFAEKEVGEEPSGKVIVPGVKSWDEYQKNLATWDDIQICVSLHARFYDGKEVKLFPATWLERAKQRHRALRILFRGRGKGTKHREAKAIGIDPAEGGDKTSMCAIDELGVIELVARKTPNTADAVNEAIAFMLRHNVPPEKVCFDRGGGGKWAADQMRERGYDVQTISFGESPSIEIKRSKTFYDEKIEVYEERYTYKKLRGQMYGEFSLLLDPSANELGFGIPEEYEELFFQLSKIPKAYDDEGCLKLPSKNKKSANSKELTLVELIGHSPDEADSAVIAYHIMTKRSTRPTAGGMNYGG
jgi:hypothetical protein